MDAILWKIIYYSLAGMMIMVFIAIFVVVHIWIKYHYDDHRDTFMLIFEYIVFICAFLCYGSFFVLGFHTLSKSLCQT